MSRLPLSPQLPRLAAALQNQQVRLRELQVALQHPDRRDFSLAVLLSTGSRTVTESYRAAPFQGWSVTPSTRCRRQRAFDSPRYRTVTRLQRPPRHPPDGQPGPPRRGSAAPPRLRNGSAPGQTARPRHTPPRPEPKPAAKRKNSQNATQYWGSYWA